jgi:excisionase family DNA binding protein
MGDLLTVKEAAYELEVSTKTVRRWVDEGRIEACEVGPTKRVRISVQSVEDAKAPRKK